MTTDQYFGQWSTSSRVRHCGISRLDAVLILREIPKFKVHQKILAGLSGSRVKLASKKSKSSHSRLIIGDGTMPQWLYRAAGTIIDASRASTMAEMIQSLRLRLQGLQSKLSFEDWKDYPAFAMNKVSFSETLVNPLAPFIRYSFD